MILVNLFSCFFIKKMVAGVINGVFMQRESVRFLNILRKNSFKLKIQFKINYTPALLFCTDSCQNVIDSSLLESTEVQKYLHFLQNDQSLLQEFPNLKKPHIHKIVSLLERRKELEKEMKNLESMSCDGNEELENLLEEEKKNYLETLRSLDFDLLSSIIRDNEDDENRNVEIKITPSVGGIEAKLFAEELQAMYLKFINYKNWKCLVSEKRGHKFELQYCYMLVSGHLAFKYLQQEGGVHRVQRVPVTEKHGKLQTSTCCVVVLPQPLDHEVVLDLKDLIIQTTLSGGPGGQNVQKNETCVRIKHVPTGVFVECQLYRFQFENKEGALKKLKTLLYNREQDKLNAERKIQIKKQMGNKDYSDKVRTYHFSQNRITDHRINHSFHDLEKFMSGGKEMDEMISKLIINNKKNYILYHIDQVLNSEKYKEFSSREMSN